MIINHNINAMNAHRSMSMNTVSSGKAMEKLSSGLRINRAGDDAAGLAISEKMRGQIRGLSQATRNAQDGISLIQTAEGGLNEVHSILQRGRELSVQAANDTMTIDDKKKVQQEIDQLMKEVDKIADNTEFNQIKLLNSGASTLSEPKQKVLEALQKSMLQQSEKMITDYFGITADNANITVILDDNYDGAGNTVAYVSAQILGNEGINLELHVDMADFQNIEWPNGGTSPNYLDRTIAHEMVHAVFDRTLNMDQDLDNDGDLTEKDSAVAKWFNEGSAEFIHGADERLYGAIVNGGGNAAAINNILNAISNDGHGWTSSNDSYAAAYAAVKYLDYSLKMASGGTDVDGDGVVTGGTIGYKDFLQELYHNGARDRNMDDAFAAIEAKITSAGGSLNYDSMSTFITRLKATDAGSGGEYINKLYTNGILNNVDTGSIGGSDTTNDATKIKSSEDVVADIENLTTAPLEKFNVIWPSLGADATNSGQSTLKIQVGPNEGTTIDVDLANIRTYNIGLSNVNVVVDANNAITKFQSAIERVSSERSRFGALQNRLEHTISNLSNAEENLQSSESRIRDVDMAKEMMNFSKNNILNQAAQAMLAQANQQPQGVLQLLR